MWDPGDSVNKYEYVFLITLPTPRILLIYCSLTRITMSIEHHLRRSRNRERRRFVIDIVLVLLFLCAVFGVFMAHVVRARNEEIAKQQSEKLLQVERERARDAEALKKKLQKELEAARDAAMYGDLAVPPAPLLSSDPFGSDGALGAKLLHASTSAEIASSTDVTLQGFTHFEDVTVTRIENPRLGFLMELPEGWSLAYERSAEIAYANFPYYFGVNDSEIVQRVGAMWVRIIRPCSSTEATTSMFRFAKSSTQATVSIREATACVTPFLVTVGYRDDAPDRVGRELFLLSIACTFYPMVSPIAPYPPIR